MSRYSCPTLHHSHARFFLHFTQASNQNYLWDDKRKQTDFVQKHTFLSAMGWTVRYNFIQEAQRYIRVISSGQCSFCSFEHFMGQFCSKTNSSVILRHDCLFSQTSYMTNKNVPISGACGHSSSRNQGSRFERGTLLYFLVHFPRTNGQDDVVTLKMLVQNWCRVMVAS